MRAAASFPQRFDARLRDATESETPVLAAAVAALAEECDGLRVLAYGIRIGPSGYALDFVHAASFAGRRRALAHAIGDAVAHATGPWAAFNPVLPEPAQRNTVVQLPPFRACDDVNVRARLARMGIPSAQQARVIRRMVRLNERFLGRIELAGLHVCRTLLCDGPRLLAFFGLFSPQRISARQRRALSETLPITLRRLLDERMRQWIRATHSAIGGVVDAVPDPFFIVRATGDIEHMNAAAAARLANDRTLLGRIAAAAGGAVFPDLQVQRWEITGTPRYTAVAMRRHDDDGGLAARLDAFINRWSLTPGQAVVLRHVARGLSNGEIAAELDCSVRGIEHHLSRIFARVGCSGRAALLARLWQTAAG